MPADTEGWSRWIETLAAATRVACVQATRYDASANKHVDAWRARVAVLPARPRADAGVWALLPRPPAAPLLTATGAIALNGRSPRAIDAALSQLVNVGVLCRVRDNLRYRVYEAAGMFDLVTDTERALASPSLDTRLARPTRPVPARR